jgi:hypothetical protein
VPTGVELIRDRFPADQPLSRFLVSMAAAANDIGYAMRQAAAANGADDEALLMHWVRHVMGHFFEAAHALAQWRNCSSEVRAFLKAMPADGQAELKTVAATLTSVGAKAIEHARNHTFHYPDPSPRYESDAELIRALGALGDEPVILRTFDDPPPPGVRYDFADKVALMVAMGKHDDDRDEVARQIVELEEGAAAFVNFARFAIAKHLDLT